MIQSAGIRFRSNPWGGLYVLPAILAIAVFHLYPLVQTTLMSLFDLNRSTEIRNGEFIGLQAYLELIVNPLFWRSVAFTLAFAIGATLLELLGGLTIASVAIGLPARWRRPLFSAWILPWAVPPIVFAAIWKWSWRPDTGLLSHGLAATGWVADAGAMLASPASAMAIVIVAQASRGVWIVGLFMVAAMATIPKGIHDAAALDEASGFHRFRRVTLPMIAPAIASVAALRLLDGVRVFEMIYGLTGGGPGAATEALSSHAYRHYFSFLDFGTGSAYAVTSMALIIFMAATFLVLMNRRRARVKP